MASANDITVVGLGLMGNAICKCYAKKGYQVHAWNRGQKNRKLAEKIPGVCVYETIDAAVAQSSLIIMSVVGDIMLETAQSMLQSFPAAWKGKTLVQFSSHEPTAIKAQDSLMEKLGGNLIGGAMMAVPETVGNSGIFLVSSKDPRIIETNLEHLQPLGKVVVMDGQDVGLAALMDIGFLQSIQFGLAGNELCCHMFQRYGVSQSFRDKYLELVPEVVLPIYHECATFASNAVFANEFETLARTFLRASSHLAVLESHQFFFEQMGLKEETYSSVYLDKFRKLPDKNNVGPAAIVKEYYFTNDKL